MDPTDLTFVKVSDFGLSVIISGHSHKTMLSDTCGTMAYMCKNYLFIYYYNVGVIPNKLHFSSSTSLDEIRTSLSPKIVNLHYSLIYII